MLSHASLYGASSGGSHDLGQIGVEVLLVRCMEVHAQHRPTQLPQSSLKKRVGRGAAPFVAAAEEGNLFDVQRLDPVGGEARLQTWGQSKLERGT
jgi:hypothetical protein